MAAGVHDVEIEQGTSFEMVVVWNQPPVDEETPAEPYDLTGAAAYLQIRSRAGAPVLLDLTSDPDGGIVLGGATGEIALYASPEQTGALIVKRARYDLLVQLPDLTPLRRLRVLKGKVTVDPAITVVST